MFARTADTIDEDLQIQAGADNLTRDELAEAGITGFFAIAREWGINNDEARILLGNPSRSRFYELRKGNPAACHSLGDDELDRLAYLTGIYAMLNILYSADSHTDWLRNESNLPADALYRPWGLGSPLQYMLSGQLKALSDIHEYVNAERGGM
ncbi:MAG TPA: hypothetical protein ENI65_03080 [Gammaproteobacteria bacterium]|nr:hypothetical protein [Gammaproteobacteria bacterium]